MIENQTPQFAINEHALALMALKRWALNELSAQKDARHQALRNMDRFEHSRLQGSIETLQCIIKLIDTDR